MSNDKFIVSTPESREKAQKIKKYLILSFIVFSIFILSYALIDDDRQGMSVGPLFRGIEPVDAEDKRNDIIESRVNNLEFSFREIKGALAELKESIDKQKENNEKAINALRNDISSLPEKAADNTVPDYINPPLVKGRTGAASNDPKETQYKEDIYLPPPPDISREEIMAEDIVTSADPFIEEDAMPGENTSSVISIEETRATSSTRFNNTYKPAREKLVANPYAGFLPATTVIPVTLYTGLDAIASGAAKSNPEPVHFLITDNGFLPGEGRYRLTDCRGVATGYGDLSTTRAKLQASRIVCLDTIENKILEAEINGFISDSDSYLGMRGTVKNREGQIAGKAFAAAFVEGAATLIAATQTTTTTVGGAAIQSISPGQAARGGLASGTGKAAELLAERYIEQMKAISPTISIGLGRKANLHISEGVALEWKEYEGAYISEINPVETGDREQ